MKKRISILGSTGSIGCNALNVLENLEDEATVIYLSCFSNSKKLIDQAKRFSPDAICLIDRESYKEVKNFFKNDKIEVLFGREGLIELASRDDVDVMLNGLVGSIGMEPTLRAIKSGVDVALSNKESLVMAGSIINEAMKKSGAKIFPVDSEHSAIWQCLVGENILDISKIILTGSGGPFLKRNINTFEKITLREALNHPNWDMGKKITIDSATMMNKGLEVIEAFWLFNGDQIPIDIVIHPQSIIHSMVEFQDGSIKAQMGVPDMKVPIQYSLTYPRHKKTNWERLDFFKIKELNFLEPDLEKFPCISLAYDALKKLGTSPAALNLANDYSVQRFLRQEINFLDIYEINNTVLNLHNWLNEPTLEDLKELDHWVKNWVNSYY
ncbi:MAG: 1-deoxy-D-xylulose-5-phosphate reductoisomerase [Candidatus Marinimicrobia bacterium]|nr:1-deoxy-D-xylulose-5-phosphate reductoisomerase [Candidatus Neomarinimicrobiota bacterium]|tara:strand:- start:1326 stop:2474 length:1149 start_codon:yes stop_codon:yes gene_type:complete